MQFLNSCNPDYQPPLYLTLTPELVCDNTSKDATGDGVVNAQLEFDGLSQVGGTHQSLTFLPIKFYL